jgi:hypothetical protein
LQEQTPATAKSRFLIEIYEDTYGNSYRESKFEFSRLQEQTPATAKGRFLIEIYEDTYGNSYRESKFEFSWTGHWTMSVDIQSEYPTEFQNEIAVAGVCSCDHRNTQRRSCNGHLS